MTAVTTGYTVTFAHNGDLTPDQFAALVQMFFASGWSGGETISLPGGLEITVGVVENVVEYR